MQRCDKSRLSLEMTVIPQVVCVVCRSNCRLSRYVFKLPEVNVLICLAGSHGDKRDEPPKNAKKKKQENFSFVKSSPKGHLTLLSDIFILKDSLQLSTSVYRHLLTFNDLPVR